MHFSTFSLLGAAAGLVPTVLAAYGNPDDYSGNNFFSMFNFETENDPTHGYVNYIDQATSQSDNLISTASDGTVTIRSDSTNIASGRGRNSVRISSKASYTHGLVVLDLAHMPGPACGIWPAFWMTGPSWPNHGEIDIIEGVNVQSANNAMTLHTSAGCSMSGQSCSGILGCGSQTGGSASYGSGFNAAQGGVYAMEWTSTAINIFFFPHGSSSSQTGNALSSSPDPSTWGAPITSFAGGSNCDIDSHFSEHNLIFDTTFCGDWAGNVWGSDPTCSAKAPTCESYVQNNPSAFTEAYWEIRSLRVFKDLGSTPASTTTDAAKDVVQQGVPSNQKDKKKIPDAAAAAANPASAPVQSSAPAAAQPIDDEPPLVLGSTTPDGQIMELPSAETSQTKTRRRRRNIPDGLDLVYMVKGNEMVKMRKELEGIKDGLTLKDGVV